MTRDKNVIFRVSEIEAEALKQLAEDHGITASEFLRSLLREAAHQAGILPKKPTAEQEPALIAA